MSEESFLSKLYEKLWSRVGGRPWTYIIRDESKKAPLLFFAIFLFMGVGLVKLTQNLKTPVWLPLVALALGIFIGHLWW